MELAQLLVEIRHRARVLPAPDVDPIEEIMRRVVANPDTQESRTLAKVAGVIGMRVGEFEENEIWSLGPEALGLLDALIERAIS